jgi:pimeloyl-ACP methyl ester carboxylesterase
MKPEPVILVHGLGANSSCFSSMERHLHREGYTVFAANYSCYGADIAACGRHLEREAAWLLDQTGSESANVVAHSLGGVVLRWAMAHTWMRDWVEVAVTLGSPHRGTPTARLAPAGLPGFGTLIGELRTTTRASDLDPLDPLDGKATRWVAVAAQHDWVVPARYARLPQSANVRNVTVPWGGHLTLPNSRQCWQLILDEFAAAERRRHVTAAA